MKNVDASRELSRILNLLTSVAARVLQTSDRKAAVALGAGTKVAVGSAVAASVTGLIGSLGTASTGTAIAGLSGAAKTTATLYWIGGIVGGGVAAGGFVLGAGALGVGIYGSIKARRAIFGSVRPEQALSERELRILEAIQVLTVAIRAALDSERDVTACELAVFSRVGVVPLLDEIDEALSASTFDDLKMYHRIRLRGHVSGLRHQLNQLETP